MTDKERADNLESFVKQVGFHVYNGLNPTLVEELIRKAHALSFLDNRSNGEMSDENFESHRNRLIKEMGKM